MCLSKPGIMVCLLAGSVLANGGRAPFRPTKGGDCRLSATEVEVGHPNQEKHEANRNHSSGLVRTLRPRVRSYGPVAFSLDGKTLATGGGDHLYLWNWATGVQKGHFKVKQFPHPWVTALAFSPDGKTLAAGYSGGLEDTLAVRLWAVNTGKVTHELRVPGGSCHALAFSPDGAILAGTVGLQIYLWETATGKQVRRLENKDALGGNYGGRNLAFSPDGKTLATGGNKVTVWDERTGKRVQQFKAVGYFVAFLPDGNTLVAAGLWYLPNQPDTGHPLFQPTIYWWNLATGKERHLVREERQGDFRCLAASPDGRMLLTADSSVIRLWEGATGKERFRLGPYEVSDFAAAFSPDGRTLATVASAESKIRVWDVLRLAGERAREMRKPSSKDLEAQWAELANDYAAKAYRAICTLVHWREHAVPFLKERLQQLPRPDPQRIAQLISELDSNLFAVRQRAMKELEKLADAAEPALKKLLAGKPSPEARQRAERLLSKLAEQSLSGERLRVLRALEVLEHIATPEVRPIFKSLAQGPPEDKLTQEARSALQRLAKRSANP